MRTRTRVKICGITNAEDARAAIEYGADALGFIFAPESPRFVKPDMVLAQLLDSLPPFITRTAVITKLEALPRVILSCFQVIQFYDDDFFCFKNLHCIRAFRIRDEKSLYEIDAAIDRGLNDSSMKFNAMLLDTYHKDKLGGSGETFNWELAIEAKVRFNLPLILAGGLTPDNVAEAIRTVRPYAVDVSSGIEAEPGRKDHAKMKAFLQAVHETY